MVTGGVRFRADVIARAVEKPRLLGQCATPNWPTAPDSDADVTLVSLGSDSGTSGVQQMRCPNCNGASAGPIVIAPDAKLANEGTADVLWWKQFTAPSAPYGNDQHSFLVWNLYRIDAQGRLEQIGVSGLKHAFFTVNTDCSVAEAIFFGPVVRTPTAPLRMIPTPLWGRAMKSFR